MTRPSTRLSYEQRINRLIDAVTADLTRDFTLDALAGIAGLSPFHLHRVFSAMLGESPVAFVRRVRLLTAAFRLQFQPSAAVTDIALACGFPPRRISRAASGPGRASAPAASGNIAAPTGSPPSWKRKSARFETRLPSFWNILPTWRDTAPILCPMNAYSPKERP